MVRKVKRKARKRLSKRKPKRKAKKKVKAHKHWYSSKGWLYRRKHPASRKHKDIYSRQAHDSATGKFKRWTKRKKLLLVDSTYARYKREVLSGQSSRRGGLSMVKKRVTRKRKTRKRVVKKRVKRRVTRKRVTRKRVTRRKVVKRKAVKRKATKRKTLSYKTLLKPPKRGTKRYKADYARKAKRIGKRRSKSGRVYYEYRRNRADKGRV